MPIVAAPTTAAGVTIIVSESSPVIAISAAMALIASLMATQSTEPAPVLRVEMGVATKGALLALLSLQRR